MFKLFSLGFGMSALVAVFVFAVFVPANSVEATDARDFNAGRIIEDNLFTNSSTMTVSDIQNFLESKVTCDSYGEETSELGGGTRAQWMAARGITPPFRCITDYRENTSTGANNYGTTVNPSGSISAAQIIYNYSRDFGINPQVIIATLQKENGLITDEWPTPRQFSQAMGFGCPDNVAPGAPACDPEFNSFSSQVYEAARHFRGFYNDQSGWYIPFDTGNNFIQFNPNGSCGGSTVNIQNRATVALYSYTPYQPNTAAKNAHYGTGDGCSAYGNRNFFLYFTDWFGSPLDGNLVRTVSSASVYLIADDMKYPVTSLSMLENFSRLGPVGYVSQSYLDSKTTGANATNLVKAEGSNTLYFINSGIRLPFTSCTVVAHYARSCGSETVLTEGQVNRFSLGPNMTRLYNAVGSQLFYIENGMRREVLDEQSLIDSGISSPTNRLSLSGISNLDLGAPVVRDNMLVVSGGGLYFVNSNKAFLLPQDIGSLAAFSSLSRGALTTASMNKIYQSGFNGFAQRTSGERYLLHEGGKSLIEDTSAWPTAGYMLIGDDFIDSLPVGQGSLEGGFIRSSKSSTVYKMIDGEKYPVGGWNDFQLLRNSSSETIRILPDSTVQSISSAAPIYAPGSLVKVSNSATVYIVTGVLTASPLSSFAATNDMGVSGIRTISQASLAQLNLDSNVHRDFVSCGGDSYIFNSGVGYPVDSAVIEKYGFVVGQATIWDSKGCEVLNLSASSLMDYDFIKAHMDRTIYYISGGEKRPISSMGTFISLGGTSGSRLEVSERFRDLIPAGENI